MFSTATGVDTSFWLPADIMACFFRGLFDPYAVGHRHTLCDHDSLPFSTLIIVVIVFQLRVVADTPKILSIELRKLIAFIWRR
jgi:hypothetical protein